MSKKRNRFFSIRVLFAFLALEAGQESTERSLKSNGHHVRKWAGPTKDELASLVRTDKSLKGAFEDLRDAGVISIVGRRVELTKTPLPGTEAVLDVLRRGTSGRMRSIDRPVPVPRAWLERWAAPSRKRVATLLHFLYSSVLSFESESGSRIKTRGAFKFNQLAKASPGSERSMWDARKFLIEDGRISADETYLQQVLNRRGHYVEVNLEWGKEKAPKTERTSEQVAVENQSSASPTMQTPRSKSPQNADPIRDTKHFVFRNQKRPGVSSKQGPDNSVTESALYDIEVLAAMFREQVVLSKTLANFQNFIGAAVRARSLPGKSVRESRMAVFWGTVHRKLWHHITNEQEGEALRLIREYQDGRRVRLSRRNESSPDATEGMRPVAGHETRQESSEEHHRRLRIRTVIEESLASVAA